MHSRLSERKVLKRKLEARQNIHMPAPRRIGKTWTINRLAEDLREAGWLIVELDVQGMSCPEMFARKLCHQIQGQLPQATGLWTGVKQRLGNVVGGDWSGNPVEALGRMDPISFLRALIEELPNEREKCAIFVDEIAYFVLAFAEKEPPRAKEFFYQLRSIQQANPKVRWLVTGSIGLDVVAERFGINGAFVDLERFVLEPFTEDEARSFLRDKATQNAFNHRFHASDEDFAFMFCELGWLAPWYLKLIGNQIRPSGAQLDGVPAATRDDFEAAFGRLLEPGRKADFAVWREHVDKNLPQPDREIARKILDKLSQGADGETRDTLLGNFPHEQDRQVRTVLDMLQNDGLVQKVSERYRFRSGLVRRYWKEYEA
jgi:uncharacterized protein